MRPSRPVAGAMRRLYGGRKKLTVIRLSRHDIVPLKRAARSLADERCALFAAHYGVSFRSISIGAARSRWGSCSAKGNLRFNYKIAALPAHLAEYIIVHEVCHLREMNHSPAFWSLVERHIPHHRATRRQLRSVAFTFTNRVR